MAPPQPPPAIPSAADAVLPRTARIDSASTTTAPPPPRARPDYDLTSVAGVRSYLEDHAGLANFDLVLLTGGTANYVFRCTERDTGETRIFKHAAPQLASNPAFGLGTERMDFEAGMLGRRAADADRGEGCCAGLKGVGALAGGKTHVHTVPFISYEKDIKLLCVGDGGGKNLKDAYEELGPDEVQSIGAELGKWLAKLHGTTPLSHVAAVGAGPGGRNNSIGVAIAGYTYTQLAETLKLYGDAAHAEELSAKVNKYAGDLIPSDRESVCHGDFWPGNIMLQSNASSKTHVLTVIDWELTRVGNSATDVAQFAAEAAMLDTFRGQKGLRDSFVRAYFRTSAVSAGSKDTLYPWLTRIALHYAVHLVVWPRRAAHWAPKADAARVARHGIAVLVDAVSDTPDIAAWGVFDGLEGLGRVARDMAAERGELEGHEEGVDMRIRFDK